MSISFLFQHTYRQRLHSILVDDVVPFVDTFDVVVDLFGYSN